MMRLFSFEFMLLMNYLTFWAKLIMQTHTTANGVYVYYHKKYNTEFYDQVAVFVYQFLILLCLFGYSGVLLRRCPYRKV